MADELKPCPFCGGPAGISYRRTREKWSVFCTLDAPECDVAPETRGFFERADAITAWNRRAGEPGR